MCGPFSGSRAEQRESFRTLFIYVWVRQVRARIKMEIRNILQKTGRRRSSRFRYRTRVCIRTPTRPGRDFVPRRSLTVRPSHGVDLCKWSRVFAYVRAIWSKYSRAFGRRAKNVRGIRFASGLRKRYATDLVRFGFGRSIKPWICVKIIIMIIIKKRDN